MKKYVLKVDFPFVTETQKKSIATSVKQFLLVLKQFYTLKYEISEEETTYLKGGVKK